MNTRSQVVVGPGTGNCGNAINMSIDAAAVAEVGRVILAILETSVENETKRRALSVLQKATSLAGATLNVTDATFNVENKP